MKKNWLLILGSLIFTTLLYSFWWNNPLLAYLDYKFYDRLAHAFPTVHTPTSTVVVEIDDKSLKEFGQWPWPRIITAKLIDTIATAKPSAIVLDVVFSERDRTSPTTLQLFYSTVLNRNITIGGLPEALQDNDSILAGVIHRSPVVLPVFSNKDMQSSVCILPSKVTFSRELQNADLYTLDDLVCSLPRFQERSHGIGHIHVQADGDGILRRLPLAMQHHELWIPSLGVAAVASVTPGIHFGTASDFLGGIKFNIGGRHFFTDRQAEVLLNFYPFSQYERISAVDILSGAVNMDRLKGKYVLIGSTALGLDSTYIVSDGSVRSGVFVHATLIENILNGDLWTQASLYKILNFSVSFVIGLLLLLQMARKHYLGVIITYFVVSISAILSVYIAWQYHLCLSIGFLFIPLTSYIFILSLLMFFIDYQNKKRFINDLRRSSEQKKRLQTALSQSESEIEYQKAMLHQKSKLAAMGEMIDNIAHQWRQPLNLLGAIIQHAELAFLKGKADAQYVSKMSTDSMEQILFMSQTIDDFRNFVKPDQKNIPFDLNQSIEESLRLLSGMFDSNGIAVSIDYSDIPVVIKGSPSEFKQVVINLLQNSKDALVEQKQTNPMIKVELLADQMNAILKITDNGGGINPKIIERIFEPYFTTKDEGIGSGIGLYLSKAIIQKMSGKIDVFSIENETLFTITVPLLKNI